MIDAFALAGFAGLASAWMLLWSAAALIPLVLHLLHQHRQQMVPWAAVELLRRVIEQQSRRIRIEQLLLLAMRMLALLLLALALARPYFALNNNVEIAEILEPPRLWVLVIDGSYSMGYREQEKSRWEAAKDRATQIVRLAAPGDAFAVVQLGKPSQGIVSQVSHDRDAVVSQIAQMRLTDSGAELDGALASVNELLREAGRDARNPKVSQVVFLTDVGKDTWRAAIEGSTHRSLRQLAATSRLSIEQVSAEIPANIAITSLTSDNQTTLVHRSLIVTARIENFSAANVAKLPVQFQLDGQTVQTEFVDLASRQSQSVNAEIVLTKPGSTVVSAQILGDRLVADDRRNLVVVARQQYQVLCLEDRREEARLVAMALAPDESPTAPIRVSRVSNIELAGQDLAPWDAVIICNARGLEPSQAKKLIEFASQGKGVICLLGSETLPDQWNASRAAGLDLLGFQLLEPSSEQDWRLDPLSYASPVVRPFATFPDAGLLTTPIFQYWRLKAEKNVNLSVDLAIENSDPLIVRHRVGAGWVGSVLSAPTSGRADRPGARPWNAIGTWPSFVPLIRQLLQAVTSGQAETRNLLVGQMILGSVKTANAVSQARITTPDGTNVLVNTSEPNPDGSANWTFGPTVERGVYEFTSDGDTKQPIVVNIDPIESSLEAIPLTSLPQSPPDMRETRVSASPASSDPPHQEFPARFVLGLLAVALIAESILAWSMGRRLA